jgi:NACHT domain
MCNGARVISANWTAMRQTLVRFRGESTSNRSYRSGSEVILLDRRVFRIRRSWSWWQVVLLVATVVMLGMFIPYALTHKISQSDPLASVLGVVAGLLTLALSTVTVDRRTVGPATPAQVESAAQALANSAWEQWEKEAVARGVLNAVPANVGWTDTRTAGMSLRNLLPHGDNAHEVTSGSYRQGIFEVFNATPGRRLVLTGAPGSGKSVWVLLLTFALLDQLRGSKTAGNPGCEVPLLLSLADWDPAGEEFETWATRRVNETYSFLRQTDHYGGDAAAALLRQGRLLLILDGLDELAADIRTAAVEKINKAVPADRPLLVTCRTAAYIPDVSFVGAEVRMLEPLHPHEAARYLVANDVGDPSLLRRWGRRDADPKGWDKVIIMLLSEAPSALKDILTSPLYASVARQAYLGAPDKAEEMTDGARFSTPDKLKAHLLDQFVFGAFNSGRRDERSRVIGARWRQAPTRRWLTSLADAMSRQGGNSFGWWLQHEALSSRSWSAIVALITAATYALTDSFPDGLRHGIAVGMALGLLIGLTRGRLGGLADGVRTGVIIAVLVFAVGAPLIGPLQSATDGVEIGLALGGALAMMDHLMGDLRKVHRVALIVGGTVGCFMGIRYGISDNLVYGVAKGGTAGLGMAISIEFSAVLTCWLRTGRPPHQPTRLNFGITGRSRTLAFHLAVGTAAGLVVGLGGGLIGFLRATLSHGLEQGVIYAVRVGGSYGVTAGLAIGLTGGFVHWLSEASPTTRAETPDSTLRTARIVALTYIIVPTALAALALKVLGTIANGLTSHHGAEISVNATAVQGSALGFCIGLVLATSFTPWPTFLAAKIAWFLQRRGPLRLMSFLMDAYRLELLRSDGAFYQFRHDELAQALVPPPS